MRILGSRWVWYVPGVAVLTIAAGWVLAHESGGPTTVTIPVSQGGQFRARCDQSFTAGSWVFTVTAKSGNVSRFVVQLYPKAVPTLNSNNNQASVCMVCPDPQGRTQLSCSGEVCGSGAELQQIANVKVNNPVVGSSITIPGIPADQYCVRFGATGQIGASLTAEVTSHP